MEQVGAQQADEITSPISLKKKSASREIFLKRTMVKPKQSVTTLDHQTGSLTQITKNPFALFFDGVPLKSHMFAQELLHAIIHPPTWPKDSVVALHLQG